MRRAVVAPVACAALAFACAAREDVTPAIAVQPGAAARAMALMGHGGPNVPTRPPPPEDAGGEEPESAPGTLAFSCVEERGAMKALVRVPCEVAVAATGATDPDDAPDPFVAERGKVSVALSAGTYRVAVSRGPEYARVAWDAEVVSGKVTWGPNEGATLLRRVVDTRGYLAVDFGGVGDADAADAARGRVFADAADGVEIVAGDVARILQAAKLDDAIQPLERVDLEAFDPLADRDHFLARLASKHPATAVGSPPARTYVRVDDDAAVSTWSPSREADLLRGLRDRRDVVVTTGPFLRVTANGAPIGGVARAGAGRDVEVKVHVECAPWLSVSRISIARASGAAVVPQPVSLHATATDARAADLTFRLPATTDDAFIVVADDAVAATGALWIDADGDGESLGRKAPPAPP
jgi:hypothetical protein